MSDVEGSPSVLAGVPPVWQEAAEEIRAHLCLLRGGAPFLSPADGWQLVLWLEAGVTPADVIGALERAAASRRAKRAKAPLTLVAAKRHLGRPVTGALRGVAVVGEPPLAPLVRACSARPPADHERAALAALSAELLAAAEDERRALVAIRVFFEAVWASAGDAQRDEWRRRAVVDLGDLMDLVDESVRASLVEEGARDQLRQRFPALTAATVSDLLAEAAR